MRGTLTGGPWCAAVAAYSAIVHSGNNDLFVVFTVFLPLALLLSATSIGMNVWLLLRELAARRAKLHPPPSHASSRHASLHPLEESSLSGQRLQQLVKCYVVHRAEAAHQARARAHRMKLGHVCMALLLLAVEVSLGTSQPVRLGCARVWVLSILVLAGRMRRSLRSARRS